MDRQLDTTTDRTRTVYEETRPWGRFEQFCLNEPVTVKIITVEPGHRLSLQRHQSRAEFWQVLDGELDITVGEKTWKAGAGERIWVPLQGVHRMGNSSDAPGRVLEVGYGTFDEQDNERLEDDYSR